MKNTEVKIDNTKHINNTKLYLKINKLDIAKFLTKILGNNDAANNLKLLQKSFLVNSTSFSPALLESVSWHAGDSERISKQVIKVDKDYVHFFTLVNKALIQAASDTTGENNYYVVPFIGIDKYKEIIELCNNKLYKNIFLVLEYRKPQDLNVSLNTSINKSLNASYSNLNISGNLDDIGTSYSQAMENMEKEHQAQIREFKKQLDNTINLNEAAKDTVKLLQLEITELKDTSNKEKVALKTERDATVQYYSNLYSTTYNELQISKKDASEIGALKNKIKVLEENIAYYTAYRRPVYAGQRDVFYSGRKPDLRDVSMYEFEYYKGYSVCMSKGVHHLTFSRD